MLTVLQSLKEKGSLIPVAAVNVLIEVAVAQGNLDKAMDLYHSISSLCVGSPNVSTFNSLLRLCRRQRRKELAFQLASEMVGLKIMPDAITYDRMILVCLNVEDDYEDGVRYFKEMRTKGFEPRFGTALQLVRTLTKYSDNRVDGVLDDLEGMDLPIRMNELRRWVREHFGGAETVETKMIGFKDDGQLII